MSDWGWCQRGGGQSRHGVTLELSFYGYKEFAPDWSVLFKRGHLQSERSTL